MGSFLFHSKIVFSFGLTLGIILSGLVEESGSTLSTEESLSDILISDICAKTKNNRDEKEIKLLCARLKSELESKKTQNVKLKPEEKEDIVSHYIPKNYDKHSAPKIYRESIAANGSKIITSKPTTCYSYLNIRSVRDVDAEKEQITLDLDLLAIWVDGNIWEHLISKNLSTRDTFPYEETAFVPVLAQLYEKIWLPDVFFEKVVSVARPKVLDKSGQILYFHPNVGSFFLRSRILITLHCNMDFAYYPSDTQKCPFFFRSDAHYASELSLKWWRDKGYGVYLFETSDPNFDYQVTNIQEISKPVQLGPETHHARPNDFLWFEIAIRRKMSFHLLQTYLPSVFFLTVTWLCFFIPTRMFEARVGVAMTTLLTQTSLFSSIRESTPVVGYVKAIDTWMVTCILFIFLALFAFTIGAWVRHEREKIHRQMRAKAAAGVTPEDPAKKKKRFKLVHIHFDKCLERYTVILLSLGFFTFAVTYWTWLLMSSDHLNWNVNSTWNDVDFDFTS